MEILNKDDTISSIGNLEEDFYNQKIMKRLLLFIDFIFLLRMVMIACLLPKYTS